MTFKTTSLIVDSESASVAGYRLLDNSRVTNGDVVPMIVGMPVSIVGDDTVKRASASSTALAQVVGLVFVGAGITLPVMIRKSGRLNLSTAEWDAVTGNVGGLVPGAAYYLDVGLGGITTVAPNADGQSVVYVGKGLTPMSLVISIAEPILL